MSNVEQDGNPNKVLQGQDFTAQGETKTIGDDTALVVGCATRAESYVASKQWNLLWRDTDLLFQSPRPMSTFENTYVLEPNVQRFTIAKVVNAIVPQLYKGLFFEDPPMVLRPRPGTSQAVVDQKSAVASALLDACQFKREVKWGLECQSTFGTGIFKWGVQRVQKEVLKRVATEASVPTAAGGTETISTDEPPHIIPSTKYVWVPFFEYRPLARVLVDPGLDKSDIREAGYVIDVAYMDFYQLKDLLNANTDKNGKPLEGWSWGEYGTEAGLKTLWEPPVAATDTPGPLRSEVQAQTTGVVHHAEEPTADNSADPLARKLEVLEYWDRNRKILVLNRKKTIFSGPNPFKKIPFLSANWWNRPKAFYGMGIGLTVGQNQRVDQGTINAILKILSFGVNPVYLRSRDSNSPTQMIRTSIGKIVSVDGPVTEAYKLLESPKVPAETWAALQNSEATTESTTGADQSLVQGSTSGPRTGMGRSATGAGILAGASATRLDGPLDNFIDQVFVPFLYIIDDLVFRYLTDQEIKDILGDELGKEYVDSMVNMQDYHDGRVVYEVLAGSSLAAKRTMAQSLTLITQILQNPEIQQFLAEIQGKYIDWSVILGMWLEASEWKDRQDVVKPMTPEMKAALLAKQQQQATGALQTQMTLNDQKAQLRSQAEDQATDNRIRRDMVREAFKNAAASEAVQGEPNPTGFGV